MSPDWAFRNWDLVYNPGNFEVRVQAENLDRHGYLTSVIQRNPPDGNMRVLYRNFGRKVILKEPLEDSRRE